MAEYIDRDAAITEQKRFRGYLDDDMLYRLEIATRRIPAADVRPVVLCKDCKWYEINELKKDGTEDRRYKPSVCMLAEQRREPNHFCADGKKREES